MNSLSEALMLQAEELLLQLQNSSVSSIVLMSGKVDNFIVGADIRMIEKCKSAAEAEQLSKGYYKIQVWLVLMLLFAVSLFLL